MTKLLISVLVCEAVGFLGAFFTMPAISTWYAQLSKPVFTPPGWVFAPAWTLLYFLMGVGASLVWNKGLETPGVQFALIIFLIQLALNLIWSYLFFGLRSPLFGLIDIAFLWIAILLTIICFYGVSQVAAFLLVPYLLWVSFAAVLNVSIYLLNR